MQMSHEEQTTKSAVPVNAPSHNETPAITTGGAIDNTQQFFKLYSQLENDMEREREVIYRFGNRCTNILSPSYACPSSPSPSPSPLTSSLTKKKEHT
jgi:hypothetical protein